MSVKLLSNLILLLLLLFSTLLVGCEKDNDKYASTPISPSSSGNVLIADPHILKHEGFYYMYGTSDVNPDLGIPVYKSTDLVNWEGPIGNADQGYALFKGQSYGDKGFWAPYVLYHDNKFYMFYTANEHIAVAISDSPSGPFIQENKSPLHPDIKEIDPHVFIDEDGKKYLYFVRFDNGNRTYGAELNEDLLSIKENTIVECIRQSQNWEIASGAQWPVTEAPAVLKHKDIYYLFYSGNDFRHHGYNVGYATSKSPLGPWTKNPDNPIIPKEKTFPGTAGCEFITNTSGELTMIYHSHSSETSVSPRKAVYSKVSFVESESGPDRLKVEEKKEPPKLAQ